jgi:flagellar hook assembly protein FlgD
MLVRSLEDGVLPAGLHHLLWDGRDGAGRAVAPGVYFARFQTRELKTSEKVMLLK